MTVKGQSGKRDPGACLLDMELDYNGGLPVWIQIKNRVVYLIGAGELKAGDKLPTVRALALALDISYNTVSRAYMDLERDGHISTRRGRGTFVSDSPVDAGGEARAAIDLLVDDMIQAAFNTGMSAEDVLNLVKAKLEKQ